MQKELKTRSGRPVGSMEHFREICHGTHFESSSIGNDGHYGRVISETARTAQGIINNIHDDLSKHKNSLFAIFSNRREVASNLRTITSTLETIARKGGQSTGNAGRIRDLLRNAEQQQVRGSEMGDAWRTVERANGFNGQRIISREYISNIDGKVLGINRRPDTNAGENRYWHPIRRDIEMIARSLNEYIIRSGHWDMFYITKGNRERLLNHRRVLLREYAGSLNIFSERDLERFENTNAGQTAGATEGSTTTTKEQIRDVTEEVDRALARTVREAEAIRKSNEVLLGLPVITTGLRARREVWLISQVNHDRPWDIKRPSPWKETLGLEPLGDPDNNYRGHLRAPIVYRGEKTTPEELGNFTFGYIGAALGFSLDDLFVGSWVAARFPMWGERLDDERGDRVQIRKGFEAYRN